MSNLALKTIKPLEKIHNEEVTDILEELLKEAKDEGIVEIVVTTRYKDDTVKTCYSGTDSLYRIIGILERQKVSMINRLDSETY